MPTRRIPAHAAGSADSTEHLYWGCNDTMHRLILIALAVVFAGIALSASPTIAACGDDVDGKRIACSCGDVVVSDTELLIGDPVTSQACLADGLLIRARAGAESIHLDLNGLTLQGTGIGSGIRVIDGGSNGAVISGGPAGVHATIKGFRVGVSARGKNLLSSLSGIVVTDNQTDGLVVNGLQASIDSVVSSNNGRDGLRLGGRQSSATNLRTVGNGERGVTVRGSGNQVVGASLGDSTSASAVSGRNNTLSIAEVAPPTRSGE
jgi:hypothetical protein